MLLSTPRFASPDITLHGKVIRKGERILVALLAADMDSQAFVDPQRFDVTRPEKDNRHLAFGRGVHYCLGAPLARLEGQIALGTLLRRLPGLRPAQDLAELSWTREPARVRGALAQGGLLAGEVAASGRAALRKMLDNQRQLNACERLGKSRPYDLLQASK